MTPVYWAVASQRRAMLGIPWQVGGQQQAFRVAPAGISRFLYCGVGDRGASGGPGETIQIKQPGAPAITKPSLQPQLFCGDPSADVRVMGKHGESRSTLREANRNPVNVQALLQIPQNPRVASVRPHQKAESREACGLWPFVRIHTSYTAPPFSKTLWSVRYAPGAAKRV